jgi:hypothetical protein
MKNTTLVPYSFQLVGGGVEVTIKIRERKDHFVITIYKEMRQQLEILEGDILILNVNNTEIIRPVRKDAAVSLPKNLLQGKKNRDKVSLIIKKVINQKSCLKRPSIGTLQNKIDIKHFISKKTSRGYPLYIIPRNNETFSVWFPIGGGVRHVTINNFVDVDEISEFLGFYFGDGSKSKGLQSIRLTNCEPSILQHCLSILENIGISRKMCKVQVIYATDSMVTTEIKRRCIKFWSNTLQLKQDQIVSVNKSYNVRETKKYGSARVCIDRSVLVEVIIHGLLQGVLYRICNPKDEIDYQMIRAFMRGLLAAEGFPEFNIYGSLVKVGIAFNPHSSELQIYQKLLTNLGINYGKVSGNALYIYGSNNMKKFKDIDAFKLHTTRNKKFLRGYMKNSRL